MPGVRGQVPTKAEGCRGERRKRPEVRRVDTGGSCSAATHLPTFDVRVDDDDGDVEVIVGIEADVPRVKKLYQLQNYNFDKK